MERNSKLYCAFVDLEITYDRVLREVVYSHLRKKGVPERLVRIVEVVDEEPTTSVRNINGYSGVGKPGVGLMVKVAALRT